MVISEEECDFIFSKLLELTELSKEEQSEVDARVEEWWEERRTASTRSIEKEGE